MDGLAVYMEGVPYPRKLSWLRWTESIQEIRKKGYISCGDQQVCYLQIFQRF